MTALEKIKKYRSFPSTLIINGLTYLGIQIAQTLLEQKGLVIILDKYTRENKEFIDKLSKYESFVFVNINGNEDLLQRIKNLNYLIYLENENIENNKNLEPKDFQNEIDKINKFLEFAVNQSTKILITTSLKVHQKSLVQYVQRDYNPKESIYSDIEQQRYIEKLCFNLHKKYKLDARIIRLGEIYGPKFELSKDSKLKDLIQQSIKSKYLKIRGDGLEENYIIHINDAVYGLVKALFSSNTNGEIFNLANYEDNSTLSLAYALLETNAKAKEIKFLPAKDKLKTAPLDPTPNLSKIGWKPRIDMIKGLSEIVDLLMTGKYTKQTSGIPEKKKKNIFRKIYDFFFITEEQFKIQQSIKQKKSKKKILEKLASKTVEKKRVKVEPQLKKKIEDEKKKTLPKIEITKKEKRKIKLNWKKYAILGTISCIIYLFLLSPLTSYFGRLLLAKHNIHQAYIALNNNDTKTFIKNLNNLSTNTEKVQETLSQINWMYQIIGENDKKENIKTQLAGLRYLARGGSQSLELTQPIVDYINRLEINTSLPIDYSSYMEEINYNAQEIDLAYIELAKAQDLLSNTNSLDLLFEEEKQKEINQIQNELSDHIVQYKEIVKVLPEILGYPNVQEYLIVFQNNYELRSTGGTIENYAKVTVEKGSITEIKNDYDITKEIDQYITPPEQPEGILEEKEGWTIENASWYPDYPTTAKQIEMFYELENNEPVDGVIAVNNNFIIDLLEITDGIILGNGTLITEQNFETEFVNNNKDFIKDVTNKLLEEFKAKTNEELLNLSPILNKALNNREVLIYFNDSKSQRIIENNYWEGSIVEEKNDYLFVIENNLGENYVNKEIERKIEQNVNITNNLIEHELKISYINNSENNDWPFGNYNNYVQIIIPQSANIGEITGIEDFEINDQYNKKLISGWVDVNYQSQEDITISYSTKDIEVSETNIKYDYLFQKQSGAEDSYVEMNITYPNNWIITKNETKLTQEEKDSKLTYFGIQDEDIRLDMEFKIQ